MSRFALWSRRRFLQATAVSIPVATALSGAEGFAAPAKGSDAAALQARIAGTVVVKGDDGYETWREAMIWQRAKADRRPDMIVQVERVEDVQEAVRFAAANGMKVTTRCGGHSMAACFLRDRGMLIDVSHSSDDVFDQALALSKVPIIASHSGPRAIFNHPRNLDDERMRKLAKAGGVLQVNSVYLVEGDHDEARNKISDRQDDWWALSAADQRQLIADKAKADATNPYQGADFELFMKSLLHCIAVMGVDHVGIGADWDGGGGVRGMEDITALPKITARLRREGFSDTDIEKIWSGNVLRVLKQAEDWAAKNK